MKTHAYRSAGVETPRESLMQVRLTVDGVSRCIDAQAARELARDLEAAAKDAEDRGAEVRESLIGHAR